MHSFTKFLLGKLANLSLMGGIGGNWAAGPGFELEDVLGVGEVGIGERAYAGRVDGAGAG